MNWEKESELTGCLHKERASTVYPHEQCSDECKKRAMFHLIVPRVYTPCKTIMHAYYML